MDYIKAENVLEDRLVRFKRVSGGQAEALCPFHSEKNPSFRINVDSASENYLRWECKGCGARGWGRALLLHLMGPEAADIVEALLPKYTVSATEWVHRRKREVLTLPEGVLELYRGWQLDGMLRAGFNQETLDAFELGYDQWHDAWTFPIRSADGLLVGIYRRMPSGRAKYLPYTAKDFPEGLVDEGYRFHKSDHVYGLNVQLGRTRDVSGPVVLVEGQKACMWVHQVLGDKVLAVAGMGVTLSPRQAELIGWTGRDVVVLYDNSRMAKSAARTSAKVLRGTGTPARAVTSYREDVPQPDDLSKDGLEKTLWWDS